MVEDILNLIDSDWGNSDISVIIKYTGEDFITLRLDSKFLTDAILNMKVESLEADNDTVCIWVE